MIDMSENAWNRGLRCLVKTSTTLVWYSAWRWWLATRQKLPI